jgi:hypothetical protein
VEQSRGGTVKRGNCQEVEKSRIETVENETAQTLNYYRFRQTRLKNISRFPKVDSSFPTFSTTLNKPFISTFNLSIIFKTIANIYQPTKRHEIVVKPRNVPHSSPIKESPQKPPKMSRTMKLSLD